MKKTISQLFINYYKLPSLKLLDLWLQVLRRVSVLLAGTAVATTVSAAVYLMTSHRDVTWSYIDDMARKVAALFARGPN